MKGVKEIASSRLQTLSPDGEDGSVATATTNVFNIFHSETDILQIAELYCKLTMLVYRTEAHERVQLPLTFTILHTSPSPPYLQSFQKIHKEVDCQLRFTKVLLTCRSVISSKVQCAPLCVHRSRRLMIAVLLWITAIIPDNNSGNFGNTCNSQASAFSYSIGAFQPSHTKEMQFCSMNIIPEVWNEILMLNESHILWLRTLSPPTHTERGQVFLWVILATDSGPVIVSSAAGSEASLSYWPASVSHWAKTQGWWHCRWEHVNFAL